MTPRAILLAARALIAEPERRTTGTWARDADGDPVDARGPRAVRWCPVGAVFKHAVPGDVAAYDAINALSRVAKARGASSVARYNDVASHADVLSLFTEAIALAPEFP